MPPLPTPTLQIPQHEARSKALINMFGTFSGYDPFAGVPAATPGNGVTFIGSVTNIEMPANRGSAERRQLSTATLGRILEIVPGLVDFEGFQLNHIVLYRQTFLEACGFGGHVPDFQFRPMLFIFQLPSPQPGNPDLPERWLYVNPAWIKNNPLMFSVEEKDDLRIVQQVTIAVGGMSEIKV